MRKLQVIIAPILNLQWKTLQKFIRVLLHFIKAVLVAATWKPKAGNIFISFPSTEWNIMDRLVALFAVLKRMDSDTRNKDK